MRHAYRVAVLREPVGRGGSTYVHDPVPASVLWAPLSVDTLSRRVRLDAAAVLKPQRSSGGHRRYSRRQLRLAAPMGELLIKIDELEPELYT